MFDILVVIPTFDLHVKPAITLVWADLIYNSVASPLWGIFGVAGMGPHITHPACLAWCGLAKTSADISVSEYSAKATLRLGVAPR